MISLLAEKLILENLDPISIKIDCDKDAFPDIVIALKDKRNLVCDPKELLADKDLVYFTPSFL